MRSYGALSVIFQLYSHVRVLLSLKPSLFIPPPKVDSAFISIVFNDSSEADPAFIAFIKQCFRYKRKQLRHSLAERFKRDEIDALYGRHGVSGFHKGGGDRAGRVRGDVPDSEDVGEGFMMPGNRMSDTVGFTTTIPVEVVFAAGLRPCDLNNLFVTHPDPVHYVAAAERDGFPKNMCNWIKGLYGVVRETGIGVVIAVMEGDCSNTRALAEILSYRGVRIIPFSFPFDRDREALAREIDKLADALGADRERLAAVEEALRRCGRVLR